MDKNKSSNKLAGLFWIISSILWFFASYYLQYFAKQTDTQTAVVYLGIGALNLTIGLYQFFGKK